MQQASIAKTREDTFDDMVMKEKPNVRWCDVVGIDVQGKQVDLLEMEVRYKGSFSPSPQFLGGVTKTFMKKLNETDVKEHYKFEKACNK